MEQTDFVTLPTREDVAQVRNFNSSDFARKLAQQNPAAAQCRKPAMVECWLANFNAYHHKALTFDVAAGRISIRSVDDDNMVVLPKFHKPQLHNFATKKIATQDCLTINQNLALWPQTLMNQQDPETAGEIINLIETKDNSVKCVDFYPMPVGYDAKQHCLHIEQIPCYYADVTNQFYTYFKNEHGVGELHLWETIPMAKLSGGDLQCTVGPFYAPLADSNLLFQHGTFDEEGQLKLNQLPLLKYLNGDYLKCLLKSSRMYLQHAKRQATTLHANFHPNALKTAENEMSKSAKDVIL